MCILLLLLVPVTNLRFFAEAAAVFKVQQAIDYRKRLFLG